jgi:hypothetical protein
MEELRRWERRRTGGEKEENNELLKLHGDERETPRLRGEKRDPEGLCGEEREVPMRITIWRGVLSRTD